jgi:hypothetical protein
MSSLPNKYVIDTNIPITANKALNPSRIDADLAKCVLRCIEIIKTVTKKGGLVIDSGDEIYNEYRHKLSMSGQPGVGDVFMKWVHDHRYNPLIFPEEDRVHITKNDSSNR